MRVSALCLAALVMMIPAGTVCAGLIFNGDFELGHSGFATDYIYTTDLTSSGTVVVGFDPSDHHPSAASYGDRTRGDGRMLIVNGSTDGNATVWGQTVAVKPNTQYAFLYWLSAWTAAADTRQAQIRCLINELRVGAAGFSGTTVGQWGCVLLRWNSGSVSQASIRLADRTGTEADNDFALDGIDMVEVGDNRVLVTASTVGGTIDMPGKGVFVYPKGEQVCLEAKCDSGYEFAGWGGNFFDLDPVMWIDMEADRVAIARFKRLDYDVTVRASGAAANEFSTCADSADRLAVFRSALDSHYPSGVILGESKGVCDATYRFPVLRPKAGIQGIARIAVNVYGSTLSAGPAVKVADGSRYPWFKGDVHQTFTGDAIGDLLAHCEGTVCWVPVKVTAFIGACDLADVYLSYDCPSIARSLLRRFHDHLSIHQALDQYAAFQDVRDLFHLKTSRRQTWETVVQTLALAQDLAGYSDTLEDSIGVCVEGLDGFLAHWQSLVDCPEPAALDGCHGEAIVACLDDAVSSGELYMAAYADAIADGRVDAEEASLLNQSMADWKGNLIALNAAMTEVFRALGEVYRGTTDLCLRAAAERMIRLMAPWCTGEPDDLGVWAPSDPTYLEQVIQTLLDFPVEDVSIP
ncbi:MAG: hypothetical protein JW955_02215 [Sedimentisphaerales bacterium]|nr:hypothetical protein [Sedimentisphaerales bacterium]